MYAVNSVKIKNWKKSRWDACIENTVICTLSIYVSIHWATGDLNKLRSLLQFSSQESMIYAYSSSNLNLRFTVITYMYLLHLTSQSSQKQIGCLKDQINMAH